MANNEFEHIFIATELADAMIEKIKEKNLTPRIVKIGDNIKEFNNAIIGTFALKLCTLLLEYAKNDITLQKEIETDEESMEEFEMLKNLFNIKGEG